MITFDCIRIDTARVHHSLPEGCLATLLIAHDSRIDTRRFTSPCVIVAPNHAGDQPVSSTRQRLCCRQPPAGVTHYRGFLAMNYRLISPSKATQPAVVRIVPPAITALAPAAINTANSTASRTFDCIIETSALGFKKENNYFILGILNTKCLPLCPKFRELI